ncbi:DUF5025 domain-containing protein [Bacteroides thetaiotaomicron]|nr:DUF5025 domain-containing protein [Bacteroides thetaiotaomicron]
MKAHTDWSVHSVKTSASPPDNDADSIRGMMTSIKYGEDELLSITIYHLHKGIRYITKSTKTDWIYDGIQITRDTHSDKYEDRYIYYIPKKEKPFQVEITKSAYADQWHPIIEGNLDGVLYRSDNPKDSIIINGSYGTR